MPRYRKLHVKTLESLDINDMPDDFARLFWVLLPLVLCREGRGLNSAPWLKSKLFPLREDIGRDQVGAALDWFIDREMIVPYTVEGRAYFHVPSFHKYQGNTVKEAESNYPAPLSLVQSSSGVSPELVQSKSATDADADAIGSMQYSDAEAISDTPAAVAALESFGMGEPEKVMGETQLLPAQVIETVQYAVQANDNQPAGKRKLGPGWLRTQLRENQAHRPRAPDDGSDRLRYTKSDCATIES